MTDNQSTNSELWGTAYAATPHGMLIEQIMDSRVPKTEREHAAAREIEAKDAEIAALKADLAAELDGNAKMREVIGAKETESMFAFAKRFVAERDVLREQVRIVSRANDTLNAQLLKEGLEADNLREQVRVLRGVCLLVEDLIEYQVTGSRNAMTALHRATRAAFNALEATKGTP